MYWAKYWAIEPQRGLFSKINFLSFGQNWDFSSFFFLNRVQLRNLLLWLTLICLVKFWVCFFLKVTELNISEEGILLSKLSKLCLLKWVWGNFCTIQKLWTLKFLLVKDRFRSDVQCNSNWSKINGIPKKTSSKKI